ncbi:protein adenylyltransferase SelO family protein [Bacteriovoracales bacterium]|nr:protein adenylyltransferase SelO family protein [Bacteriovoracales bacterium]
MELAPTPLPAPQYVAHSTTLFRELGLSEELATTQDFVKFFSGDLKAIVEAHQSGEKVQNESSNNFRKLHTTGWASGYALSIMGEELYHQCPFQNGNGYGDGRAISILELKLPIISAPKMFFGTRGNHRPSQWEFQLKGGGRTPYCRGADGRAVLRSSVREFIVSEAMASLGVPTTRALSLIVSKSQKIARPWYSEGSRSEEPDVMLENAAAITTRVSSSFLRVGQIELFGRRARKNEHPNAMKELKDIVSFAIQNEYLEIDLAEGMALDALNFNEKILMFVESFGKRLAKLVGHWIRVGFCQGNFNSDNCSIGGFTLDYGPFGLMEKFDQNYQPWTGGGLHYSFLQQPNAAVQNFKMLCVAVRPLLADGSDGEKKSLEQLEKLLQDFPNVMKAAVQHTFSLKMGLKKFSPHLYESLMKTMNSTPDISVDWTIFWRKLSNIPKEGVELRDAFYDNTTGEKNVNSNAAFKFAAEEWTKWLVQWHDVLKKENLDSSSSANIDLETVSGKMKGVNPKYIPREWMLIKAYRDASDLSDFKEIHTLQQLFDNDPYAEQTPEMEAKYYKKVDQNLCNLGGYSKMSCSS